MFASVK